MERGGGKWAVCHNLCSKSDTLNISHHQRKWRAWLSPTGVYLMPLRDFEQHLVEASSRQGSHHKDHRFKHRWLKPHALATWEPAGSSSARTGGILQLSAAGSCSRHQDGTCHAASQRWGEAKAEVTVLRSTGVSGARPGRSARTIKHPSGLLGKTVPLQTGWM